MKAEFDLTTTPLINTPIIIGCNVFGWTLDKAASFEVLDALFETGFRTLDTANIYSAWVDGNTGGESETIIGEWMKSRNNRDQMTLITKVGMEVHGEQGLAKDYILRANEASLKRLQTEYVDVYLSHQEDPETPIEETLEAYQILLDQHKVKTIGASNYCFEGLKASIEKAQHSGLPLYQIYQPSYNLYDREDFETQYQDFCQTHHIAVIPYWALASGFLTGKYRKTGDAGLSQRGDGVVNKYLNARGERILNALDDISASTGASQAAIALAWLMAQPTIAAPIASVTKASHIEALRTAAALKLSTEHLDTLNQASAPLAVPQ